MNIQIVYQTDPERKLTDPLPEKDGIVFRLVKGQWLDPQWLGNGGGWFTPPPPRITFAHYFKWVPVPFLAWRRGSWSGYVGAKVYGVDSPAYTAFTDAANIYEGSLAFCVTCRPFAKVEA